MGSAAQPFLDWRDKLLGWSNEASKKSKPQVMNWKPEPNEEQKKQIAEESATKPLPQPKVVGKKNVAPRGKGVVAPAKRIQRKRM